MEENAKKKATDGKEAYRRPPFTVTDWVVAALSIALMIYILFHLPAF
ncbi:MAG: hypothetical protein HZC43_02550 [Nitrosomonadales bacterium]|nr:hypothetical protein [Nitrosomonadales bacterium]